MKYTISKDLFEAVMDWNDVNIFELEDEISYTRYANLTRGTREGDITYNDFFFRCKEWALKQQICLTTGAEEYMPHSWKYACYQSNKYRPDPQERLKRPLVEHKIQTPTMYSNNEKQCLFDACHWILEMLNETK